MSRGKFTWDEKLGKLVPYGEQPKTETHGVITDEIEPLESMVSGRIHTSKASLRAEYRRYGVIEKGNDHRTDKPVHFTETDAYQRQLEEDATKAWYAVRDGMAPLTELDKERCKIMDHNMENYSYDRRERDRDGNPRE